jgi:CubicO group peptidase (beta-lactamase class C family)
MRLVRAALIAAAVMCVSAVPFVARVHTSGATPQGSAAVSPEVKRLKELLAVVNTGDAAAVRAYLQASSVSERTQTWDPFLLQIVLDLYRLSRGLELARVTTDDRGRTVGILRNKTTWDEHALAIMVEPQAPHRITGLPILHPAVIAALVRPVVSVATSEKAQLEEFGAYLKRLADADIFSGVVVIARDGRPVFSEAVGYADRDKKIANTLSTPFLLGSMNKLFTGLAIGQLVERGRISYDDPLSKFLPDYPDAESAKRIKIKHLLSHTSGLGDYSSTKTYNESLDRMRTVPALVEAAGRERPKFEPGTKWAYSNTGFVLLGRVIEIVTGEDYYDYMSKNVFAPAGMSNASFPIYPRNAVATVEMAYPYESEFNGERLRYVNKLGTHFRRGSPSGAGLASALDLIELTKSLHSGKVVTLETFRLHSTAKPELGAPTYGYGFQIGARMAKRPLVGHGGNSYGQCTEFGDLKDTPYTIVVLSNQTIGTCMSVTGKILRVLAPSKVS